MAAVNIAKAIIAAAMAIEVLACQPNLIIPALPSARRVMNMSHLTGPVSRSGDIERQFRAICEAASAGGLLTAAFCAELQLK
jgi:hypothetical protein